MTDTDAEKLRTLADWFDKKDRQDLTRELNVTESQVPDYMLSGTKTEVQRDLRRIADELERLQQPDLRIVYGYDAGYRDAAEEIAQAIEAHAEGYGDPADNAYEYTRIAREQVAPLAQGQEIKL